MKVELLNKNNVVCFFMDWGKASCSCYQTPLKHAERVGKACLKSGHYSGSRGLYFTFSIEGISRACATQLNRHEIGVFKNQTSLRYCKPTDTVLPMVVEDEPELKAKFQEAYSASMSAYDDIRSELIRMGYTDKQANEDARAVLPLGTATGGVWGFTLEALINLANKRLCSRSQDEIRMLTMLLVKEVVQMLPELKPYLVPSCVRLGFCPEGDQYCGMYKRT